MKLFPLKFHNEDIFMMVGPCLSVNQKGRLNVSLQRLNHHKKPMSFFVGGLQFANAALTIDASAFCNSTSKLLLLMLDMCRFQQTGLLLLHPVYGNESSIFHGE